MRNAAVDHAARRQLQLERLGRSTELHKLMIQWRRRLKLGQIPGFVNAGRVRRQEHVSQEDMARLTGVDVAWYGALERGRLDRRYSSRFLDRLAFSLKLNTGERRALYLLVTGCEPPPRRYAQPKISSAVRVALDNHPYPAYIYDAAWNVLASNQALHEWFPKIFEWENNIMRLMFCYPECQLRLVDWETKHARLMLGQLRAQHTKMPDNQELKLLIAEILEANDTARRLWEEEPHIYFHDDGDPRQLFLPFADEPTNVEVLSWTPLRNPDLTVTMLVPTGGYIPEACQKLRAHSASPRPPTTARHNKKAPRRTG